VRPIGADCDIVAGDVIVTSGMGGIYPKGHIVADVISVEQDKYGVSTTAIARPRVDFQRLEEVLVLIDPTRGAAR
jgi:rod shape-determining protein MreC